MQNQFKIEPDVPLPIAPRGAPPSPIKYPWEEMKIGDSFLVPLVGNTIMSARSSLAIDLKKYNHQTMNKVKITTRSVDNGIRVWRTK